MAGEKLSRKRMQMESEKLKGSFVVEKGNHQRAVASHPAVPGVDFRKQAFVLSVFLNIFTYLVL